MLSAVAMCAVLVDWYNVRMSHLGYIAAIDMDFRDALLTAAGGDEMEALRELTEAEIIVLAMKFDDFLPQVQACERNYDHLKR